MSVILPAERDEAWAPRGNDCWSCSEPVSREVVAVVWMGTSDGPALLHTDCAERLGVSLIGDVREAKLAGGTGPWSRRAARAAGASMRAEEARGS